MHILPRDLHVKRPSVPRATAHVSRCGTPSRMLRSFLDSIEDAAQHDRLWNAIRLDNCGIWFLCKSHWTVAQLERRFTEELVGSILYERIGGMLQGDKPYVYLQIALVRSVLQKLHPDSEPEWIEVPTEARWPELSVETALKDIQVHVISEVPDIREVIQSGRY